MSKDDDDVGVGQDDEVDDDVDSGQYACNSEGTCLRVLPMLDILLLMRFQSDCNATTDVKRSVRVTRAMVMMTTTLVISVAA